MVTPIIERISKAPLLKSTQHVMAKQSKKRFNRSLAIIVPLAIALFIYVKPQQFVALWLTPDQQGQILFNLGDYQKATRHFTNAQWQAYANYGAEEFKNAAQLYSQFSDTDNMLAQANAFAHAREYLKARNLYREILISVPQHPGATKNLAIVQKIIDEINLLSASQKAEQGEAIKELGDEPQTADGAERQEARTPKKVEQLTAEQLLLDPSLNAMWLRQVQKDPARFLSQKFFMQQQKTQQNSSSSVSSEQ